MRRTPLFLKIGLLTLVGVTVRMAVGMGAPSRDSSPKSFIVKRGESAAEIALKLKQGGFIKSSGMFKLAVKLTGLESRIQAGEYLLTSNLKLNQLVQKLKQGPQDVWITFPEGWRKEEMEQRLSVVLAGGQFFGEDFLARASFPDELEGRLFPDTYLISKTATAAAILSKLTDNFDKKTSVLPTICNPI